MARDLGNVRGHLAVFLFLLAFVVRGDGKEGMSERLYAFLVNLYLNVRLAAVGRMISSSLQRSEVLSYAVVIYITATINNSFGVGELLIL